MTKDPNEPAPFLDLTDEQRKANKAHVAAITETVRKVALTCRCTADVDDFRRVLVGQRAEGGSANERHPHRLRARPGRRHRRQENLQRRADHRSR